MSVPMINVTRETGCMEVIPGAFKLGYLEHVSEGGTSIRPDLMPDIEPVCAECPRGGVVFMNKLTPHRSTPNHSDIVRWTIDLRYQKTGTPTGRPFYPDFPTRSARDPNSVLSDHGEWCRRWTDGMEAGKGQKWHRHAHTAAKAQEVGY